MPAKKRGDFDYLNFAYGLGAAIVIVGAMFKFLGWAYANEMFLVGLSTEAVVFLVSGVEFKTKSDRLRWERVFPQLDPKYRGEMEKIDLSKAQEIYFKNTQSLVDSVDQFNGSINKLNEAVEGLTNGMEKIGTSLERIDRASAQYEVELNELKEKMSNLNTFYNQVKWVGGSSDSEK